jgi:MFS family permease
VLTLSATPMAMGWLRVASAIPVVVLGLVVGLLIDRFPRRPFLLVTDFLRAILLLTIPVAAITGQLNMGLLFVVTAVMAMLNLVFTVAYESYVPTLVGREWIVDGNAKLSVTQSFAEIVGPSLTGVLVQALTAPFAILLDALSYLASAFSIWRIRTPEPKRSSHMQHSPVWRDVLEGLRVIVRNRTLLALAATAATSALFSAIVFTMDTLYAIQTLHLSAALFGFTVTFGGVGALIGAAMAQPLVRRFGYGRVLVSAAFLEGVFNCLIPLASGSAWTAALFLIGAQLLGDLWGVVFGVLESSLRQAITDDRVLGRVNAGVNLLTSTLSPVGALLGGWVATVFGLRAAMAVGVGGMTVAACWLLTAPILRIRTLPADAETRFVQGVAEDM